MNFLAGKPSKRQHKAMQHEILREQSAMGPGRFGRLGTILALLFTGAFTLPGLAADPMVLNVPANSSGDVIQGALDRLVDGGEVVLEAGTYIVHRPIMLQSDHLSLRGAGPA